jgi:group II intron reverse transcriptase/maturase
MESQDVYTKQQRIAELAGQRPRFRMVSLNQHLDMDWMREAYRQTRKSGAAGVDGVTAERYERDLDANLANLLERAKSGSYQAPPVRRTYIPKGRNEQRALGIPTLEDKVLQRAVVMLLQPVYEQDFLDCSHGFRPGRSPHTALDALWKQIMGMRGCWLIDADIRKFFDTLPKSAMREVLNQRVGDGVIRRLVSKWLHAGVMEEGLVWYPEAGTPQGGVISPLLSNIYLHAVLDEWFEHVIKPRLRGRAFLLRFADDFVMGFERQDDARRVLEVLPKRFGKHGLAIHPQKTRLVSFYPPERQGGKRSSFDFVGFTHYWDVSRRGRAFVRRSTRRERFTRALQNVRRYCRKTLRKPVKEQWQGLCMRMRGHYGFYGITGNARALGRYRYEVGRIWWRSLNRRSGHKAKSWGWFNRKVLPCYPLPPARVVHSVYA